MTGFNCFWCFSCMILYGLGQIGMGRDGMGVGGVLHFWERIMSRFLGQTCWLHHMTRLESSDWGGGSGRSEREKREGRLKYPKKLNLAR